MDRPRTPTEEEISAVLADARASDPAGYTYDEFYYTGDGDEEEAGPPNTPRPAVEYPPEDFTEGDVAMYFHPETDVWRAFPPPGVVAITNSAANAAGGEAPRQRRRDRLRDFGVRVIRRIRRPIGKKDDGDQTGKVSRITRIKRRLTLKKK